MEDIIGYSGIIIFITGLFIINRHIIGLPGYGLFGPLLIGGILSIMPLPIIFIGAIIFSTIIGRIIMNITTQHIIHLSLYPKYGSYMISSLITLIIIFEILYNSGYAIQIDNSDIMQLMIMFLVISTHSLKIYNSGKGFLSLVRRLHIIIFFGISFGIGYLFQSEVLLIIMKQSKILILLNILIVSILATYKGLQIKEMIRFRKLIWGRITNKKKKQ